MQFTLISQLCCVINFSRNYCNCIYLGLHKVYELRYFQPSSATIELSFVAFLRTGPNSFYKNTAELKNNVNISTHHPHRKPEAKSKIELNIQVYYSPSSTNN